MEVERISREVLAAQIRVLGEEHPKTLGTAKSLVVALAYQGKLAEAEPMLQATLTSCQRVLGPAHSTTLGAASSLQSVRSKLHAKPPTKAAARAGTTAARLRAALSAKRDHGEASARKERDAVSPI